MLWFGVSAVFVLSLAPQGFKGFAEGFIPHLAEVEWDLRAADQPFD
jgi:hypothetical protein